MTTSPKSEIVLDLAEDFIGRLRRGERPALSEYIARFPDLAEEIRDVLPAMAMLENIAPEDASLAAGAPLPANAPPFHQLGDYRIIREVGRGGMGVVYEAEQLSLGRHVALKLLPGESRGNNRHKQRFEREARAAARLHHTNIVPVFSVGEHDGMPYYVMQFIQGLGLDEVLRELQQLRDLGISPATGDSNHEFRRTRREFSPTEIARSIIEERGANTAKHLDPDGITAASGSRPLAKNARADLPESISPRPLTLADGTLADSSLSDTSDSADFAAVLPGHNPALSGSGRRIPAYWRSIGHIGVQVAEALQHAHDQGILHRDVKPSNLLLDTRGTVWVTDFGLAKTNDHQDLTQSGDVLGTLRYMSPEAFQGKSAACSDVYSLGMTLYELAALRPGYDEKERLRLIRQITTTEPPRLDKLGAAVPRDLVTVIHKAIERDPDLRYGTAGELAADLKRFLDDEPIRARRPSVFERLRRWSRRNRQLAAALSLISLMILGGAIVASIAAAQFHEVATRMTNLAAQRDIDRKAANTSRDDALEARHNEQELRHQAESAQELATQRAETARQNLYFAQMSLARHGWKEIKGLSRLQDLLLAWSPRPEQGADAPRDLRGWEWFYLMSHLSRSRLIVREEAGPIMAGVYSPDGTRFAIATHLRGAEICDTATGRRLVAFREMMNPMRTVAWSRDGKLLAGGGDDQVVMLWNVDTGRRVATLAGHQGTIFAVEFSPDGRRLLSASRDQTIRLWDVFESREIAVLHGHTDEVRAARWSPDGTQIVSASPDGTLRRWDTQTYSEVARWGDPMWRPSLDWSPDGQYIAGTSSDDLTCKLWDARSGREVRRFRGHLGEVVSLAYDPQGGRLATTGIDGAALVWDVETGRLLKSFRGHLTPVTGTSWSPDGRQLLTTGTDGVVRIWDVSREQEFTELRGHTGYPKCLAWSRDGRSLASGGNDQTLRVWEVETGRERVAYPAAGAGEITSVSWHPHQPWIASGHQDGSIRIRDDASGRLLATLAGHTQGVTALEWNPAGRQLAAASHDHTVTIWDASRLAEQETGAAPLRTLRGHASNVMGLSFSADGQALATCGADATIRIWETSGWTETAVLHGGSGLVHAVSWSPDGRRLAACNYRGTGTIWDVATQTEWGTLAGHTAFLYTVGWSPDGTRIATGGMDRQVKLWDAATGAEVISFDTHPNQVIALAWSPDGTQLATASFDRTLHILDATPASEVHGVLGFLKSLDRRLASNPDSARDHELRSQTLARLNRADEAQSAGAQAAEIYERQIAVHPDTDRYAGEYSQFLLERALSAVEWKPVAPLHLRASGGETLSVRSDAAVLVAGPIVKDAVYELAFSTPAEPVTGLRLEVLTDPSLPQKGPGRNPAGNFVLTQFQAFRASPVDSDGAAEIVLRSVRADFAQNEFRVARTIEKSPGGDLGWGVYPAIGLPHAAIFELERPEEFGSDGRMTLTLSHTHAVYNDSAVGCFRVSLTTAPNPARLLQLSDDLHRSAARGWPRLAAVSALTGNRSTAELALERSASLDGTLTGEELFLLALAAAWLEQPAASEVHLARALEWTANHPTDETLVQLAVEALAAVRHLSDTPARKLLLCR